MTLHATPDAAAARLVSLDALRGLTIAGMILVNNPGSWRHRYGPLRHARWDGWTPTDLVFPFFLFIVGASIALSFARRIERGDHRGALLGQVVRRSIILFLLGLMMYAFPDWRLIGPFVLGIVGLGLVGGGRTVGLAGAANGTHWRPWCGGLLLAAGAIYFALDFGHFEATQLRVPGVLQRIAVCYLVTAIIALSVGTWGRAACLVIILVSYAWIVHGVSPPTDYTAEVTGASGLLHDWIDVQVFGGHLYRERPDPEGLLSTWPAIGTTLLGLLAGGWLRGQRDRRDTTIGMFAAATMLVVGGCCWDGWFPINKKIWSPSYVLLTGGLALHLLALGYWLIDVRGWRRWAWPFVVFGTNAIVVFVASSLLAKWASRWQWTAADGSSTSAQQWIYTQVFASWAGPLNGSLAYAVSYVLLWLVLLLPLYRQRIFVRI